MKTKLSFLILTISLLACRQDQRSAPSLNGKVFSEISTAKSKVSFENKIYETEELNFFKYLHLFHGGGVGIGDINNDNLPDLYFTSTLGFDKLYLNKGNFEFEDITKSAGITEFTGHKTGVNMVDINNDGWLDIYVCRSGWSKNPKDKENILYINQKDGSFIEDASSFNLNENSNSIQSVFFDYDKDGDLDLYISTFPSKPILKTVETIMAHRNPTKDMTDKFYRNEGNGKFIEIGQNIGINNATWALGVVAADFNNDGWTDVYVTSDFEERDHYYVNQQDGTFKENLEECFNHTSYFSMGVDFVDINNDKSHDLFIGEMLSEENLRQKTNMAPMNMQKFAIMASNGLYFQYMKNSFFLNNGLGQFSDISQFSGIDKSDWSWGSLFGDYDNDGDNDLLVVNGYLKDTGDKDLQKELKKADSENNTSSRFEAMQKHVKSTPLKNYAFEYVGGYKFENVSDKWGFNHRGFSNGLSTGDLDNDGDLDVVINNINSPAVIYKNNSNSLNFFGVDLLGPASELNGYNTKLYLYTNSECQYKEFQPSRGYQSSVDQRIHFGLKSNEEIDSLVVIWQDGTKQTKANPQKGQYHKIKYKNTKLRNKTKTIQPLLREEKNKLNLNHIETWFDDYQVQVLIPHLISQLGPALATGDLNNDGREDAFYGGAHKFKPTLLIQDETGNLQSKKQALFAEDAKYEDTEALFFDFDGDKDLDIYVGSGSSEFMKDTELNQDRIYINDGEANFNKRILVPNSNNICGSVAVYDFDKDGDNDIFVGTRVIGGKYPSPASSKLYVNENGKVIDRTDELAPELNNIGLINSSIWFDYNEDGNEDLILAGEWSDILVMEYNGQSFEKKNLLNQKLVGWWNTIEKGDLDQDGKEDLILGNLGLNYKYKATESEPFEVFYGDFDNNQVQDVVLGYNNDGQLFPVRGFQCSSEQIPDLKKQISTYEEFGNSDIYKIYGANLNDSQHYAANYFSSAVLWNEGNGNFTLKELNTETQFSPIQDFVLTDINNDNKLDVIGAGNWFVAEIETTRADSGIGFVLINKGERNFEYLPTTDSGLFANRDVRQVGLLKNQNTNNLLLIANNASPLQVFKFQK